MFIPTLVKCCTFVDAKSFFHMSLSKGHGIFSSGLDGLSVALITRVETTLIDWILIDSQLCAARLESSIQVKNRCSRQYPFVIFVCAPTYCNQHGIKNEFHRQLSDLHWKQRSGDIVVPVEDLDVQVRYIGTGVYLNGKWRLAGHKSRNRGLFLQICADHHLFLTSTNYLHNYITVRDEQSTFIRKSYYVAVFSISRQISLNTLLTL